MPFDHRKLDVYNAAIDFVVMAHDLVELLPGGRAYLADQLQRASTSIPLNIAEGAAELSGKAKARFGRKALRSATECAALLDVLHSLRLVDEKRFGEGEELLVRIVAMLAEMASRTPPDTPR